LSPPSLSKLVDQNFKQSEITEKCTQLFLKYFLKRTLEETSTHSRSHEINLFLENKLYYTSPAVIYFWILFLMNL